MNSKLSRVVGYARMMGSLSKANLTKIGLISVFITLVDTVQSYYGQRVINVFTEFNAIPAIYYSHGLVGYLVYSPIEFSVVYAMLLLLWFWSSYILWYHENVVSKSRFFGRSQV
ncbi:MAG TPA: hypothetical protein VFF30_13965 [Nitrososphaerales archaeon]|nr:hypothetical protein [Nitrososphaerales archaeon]